jgi:hypothetical protein
MASPLSKPLSISPQPLVINFVRSRTSPRGFLLDPDLRDHKVEELRRWRAQGRNFVIKDTDTGEDITRILLA